MFGGAMIGGLLGLILLGFINSFVSRNSKALRPGTDSHPVSKSEKIESAEARYVKMQDAQMEDLMRFPPRHLGR